MTPVTMMTTPVTITRSERVEWDTDRLGRPTRVDYSTKQTVCRLVRADAPEFDAARDGYVASTYRCYLPSGTGVTDADVLTIGGQTYRPVAAADGPRSPLSGVGYDVVLVRLVVQGA